MATTLYVAKNGKLVEEEISYMVNGCDALPDVIGSEWGGQRVVTEDGDEYRILSAAEYNWLVELVDALYDCDRIIIEIKEAAEGVDNEDSWCRDYDALQERIEAAKISYAGDSKDVAEEVRDQLEELLEEVEKEANAES